MIANIRVDSRHSRNSRLTLSANIGSRTSNHPQTQVQLRLGLADMGQDTTGFSRVVPHFNLTPRQNRTDTIGFTAWYFSFNLALVTFYCWGKGPWR